MKLYYSPAASSLSPHIALREAGLTFTLEKVDLKTRKTAGGTDFSRISAMGYVPALQFDDGTVLTEVSAIVQWIADQVPERELAPAAGTMARYQLMAWLNLIASEIHKLFTPLFDPATPEATRQTLRELLARRFDGLQKTLTDRTYLAGDHFTVADAYLYTVLGWAKWVDIDLARWPQLADYMARVGLRPKVREALQAEGLLK